MPSIIGAPAASSTRTPKGGTPENAVHRPERCRAAGAGPMPRRTGCVTVPVMRHRSVSRGLGLAGLAILLACAFTPLATSLAGRLGRAPRIEPADAIVVLGAGILSNGTLSGQSVERALYGMRLHRRGLAPLLVFTGERATERRPSEPAVRAALASELGFAGPAVLTVSASTTREEAAGVAALLRPRGVRRILLVTESLHLVRAGGVFEQAGLEVLPAPADRIPSESSPEARLALAREILQEALARLLYRWQGPA
jgi:uncharacterized SAM-binding protein YcdF (DUF218 family)